MKCCIYFIVNKVTNEFYVGQTTNFSRRKSEHFSKLDKNLHPNKKLQNSYNKYGKKNFEIIKLDFDITKEELSQKERFFIKKLDSYNNGFNLTEGGDGGDTRSKLNFDDYCFAYFGNKKYPGMTNRTAKILKVDSSSISAIVNEKSYLNFLDQAKKMTNEQKEKYILDFEDKTKVIQNPPWTVRKTLDDETTFNIMCVVSTYGRGIESAILKRFNLSKGFVFHLIKGNGRIEIKRKYLNLSKESIQDIGRKFFKEWDIQSFSKVKIKEDYKNLFDHYELADQKAL